MAKKVDNEKGFLVIEVSAAELSAKAGGYGICDYCNTPAEKGYYIAVLNQWYCPKCYDEFCKRAKYTKKIPERRRGTMSCILNYLEYETESIRK